MTATELAPLAQQQPAKPQANFLTKLYVYVSPRRVCFLHSMLTSIKTP